MHIKVTNGTVDTYPYSVGQLRRDNPQTSFPKTIPTAMLEEYGVFSVTVADMPTFDERTQNVSQQGTPSMVDGAWVLGWDLSSKTADEISEFDADTAIAHRTKRNKLLADSDWTQMNDSPLTNEVKTQWAVYRSELRGITDLDAWPNLADEDWPVAP